MKTSRPYGWLAHPVLWFCCLVSSFFPGSLCFSILRLLLRQTVESHFRRPDLRKFPFFLADIFTGTIPQIFFCQTIPAHFLNLLISCFIFLSCYLSSPPSITFFASTTILPFFWEYSQVESVSSFSPYTAISPVS